MSFRIDISKLRLFDRGSVVEGQIDQFLDKLTESGLIFQKALKAYFEKSYQPEMEPLVEQCSAIESKADALRRDIETQLYVQTLIPDLRGDVMQLLERLDGLINCYEANLYRFSIQRPDIPRELSADFIELTQTCGVSVDVVVLAVRAFFRDIDAVRDHCAKVMFYEHEADVVSSRLQRAIFSLSLPLDQKIHLRYFVERIDELANAAEDVADALTIYAIKRRI